MAAASKKSSVNTTAELAKHLGLSRWAVSRAINGQPGVSGETAERVRKAMSELAFAPSPHARGLRGQRTGMIGISIRDLNTQVAVAKLTHAHRRIGDGGFRPLMAITGDDPKRGVDVINNFISMRVEGVLLVDAPPVAERAAWEQILAREEIPTVLLEPREASAHNTVSLDRVAALRKVTEHLLNAGHRRFALLGISRKFPMGIPRHEGVRAALESRGMDFGRCVDVFDMPERRFLGMRYGHELARMYLASKRRATALIALDDLVASGALWELRVNGVDVPRDCSLFGFDNLPLTDQISPMLSTVDHNVEAMIEVAVDMLQRLLSEKAGEGSGQGRLPSVKLPATLMLRESTGPVPARR